ncbi:hypothetical protein ACFVTY_37005 [Streptomyces sp. NPDC058067]|uniref:hypothetical protein n=1 Tax=Streptomyces sp. NPDC058067 TaxID=3346324 RepID=UPI0036F0AAEB
MPTDPYAILRALLRAEATRDAQPAPETPKPPTDDRPQDAAPDPHDRNRNRT